MNEGKGPEKAQHSISFGLRYRAVSGHSFSIPCNPSRMSLPPNKLDPVAVAHLSLLYISWNLIAESLAATTMHPSSLVRLHIPSSPFPHPVFGPPGYGMGYKARYSLYHGIATICSHAGHEWTAILKGCSGCAKPNVAAILRHVVLQTSEVTCAAQSIVARQAPETVS